MIKKILQALSDAQAAIQQLASPSSLHFLEESACAIAHTFQIGGKLLIAGNGGSLCDAAHFAEELTGIFREERKALPAIALSDAGHLTCVANDLGFDRVFARAIEAYGKQEDIFVGLSTSGNSSNVVRAFKCARELGLYTIAFLGKGGGKLKGVADLELIIEGCETSDRIQEVHMTAIHILIELIEEKMFGVSSKNFLDQIAAVVKQ